jgi:hypothetical protein
VATAGTREGILLNKVLQRTIVALHHVSPLINISCSDLSNIARRLYSRKESIVM